MNKPSKSQALYERNMELQQAMARISELTESLMAKSAKIGELEAALAAYPRDITGWICSRCHRWNKPKDNTCQHDHSVAALETEGKDNG